MNIKTNPPEYINVTHINIYIKLYYYYLYFLFHS